MSADERLERLMQQEIDGANQAEESAELARRLADDPAAQAAYDELRAAVDALDDVDQTEPPRPLWPSVSRSLQPPRRVWRPRWRPAVAWGFAAGLAAGLLVLLAVDDGLVHPTALEPWMQPFGAMGLDPGRAEVLAATPYQAQHGQTEVTISAVRDGETIVLDVMATSPELLRVVVTGLDGQACRGWSVSHGNPAASSVRDETWALSCEGSVRARAWFTTVDGAGRFHVRWQLPGGAGDTVEIGSE